MKRIYCGPRFSLQLTACYISEKNKSATEKDDTLAEKEKEANLTSQRLVHSLGFEPEDMDGLLRSFTTGEKAPKIAAQRSSSAPLNRLASACMSDAVLLPLFGTVAVAYNSCRGPMATSVVGRRGTGMTDVLNRRAIHFEEKVKTFELKHLSEAQLRCGALAALSLTLLESMREFRREGKRRRKEISHEDAESIKQLHMWRYEVLTNHVEAFASLHDVCCSVLGMNVEDESSKQTDAACRREMFALSAMTIFSTTLSITDELHWHLSRPHVKRNDDGGRKVLEQRVAQGTLSIMNMTHTFLERIVEENTRLLECDEGVGRLLSILSSVENGLAVIEGSLNFPYVDRLDGGCFFTLFMTLLLQTIASLPQAPRPNLEWRLITCLQGLWHKIAPPLERRSSDKVMTHRTIHASLNLRYAHLRSEPQEGNSYKLFGLSDPRESSLRLLKLLERTSNKFASWQMERDSAETSMTIPHAVLCRTILEIEVEIYFFACRNVNCELTTPTDLLHTDVDARRKEKQITDPVWKEILQAASSLRISVSFLIHRYIGAYASHDLRSLKPKQERKKNISFIHLSVFRFMKGISTSFFPLLRRHYIDSAGTQVLTSSLQSFLAVKQLSDILDGDGEERRRGVNSAFRVCGVTLSQATEVAFFLSVYKNKYQSQLSGFSEAADAIDGQVVLSYVKEVLFALDHNTAKQLWHLRSKKTLRCFTGLSCGDEARDQRQERRQAQSILSVVHAHVVHPSFLWMPLFQLQEVVFVLSQNRKLIEGVQEDSKHREAHYSSAIPSVFRVGSMGGTLRHFSRALGYLTLRLYVVTNVLRCYRDGLAKEGRPSRLPQDSPAPGAKKYKHRVWAKSMALTLNKNYVGMAAEVEGLDPAVDRNIKLANCRVLRRLEDTCALAVRHSLLSHVKKQRRKRRAERAMLQHSVDSAVANASLVGSTPPSEECRAHGDIGMVTIHLKRADPTTPLGFSLYGERPVIRRLAVSDQTNESNDAPIDTRKKNNTPFTVALRAAGILDPSSVVGWRVVNVDGTDVTSSKSFIPLLKGKQEFSLTLVPSSQL